MPDYNTLAAFIVATAVFAYMPGPSTLYAAARTIAGGRQAGLMAALGLHLGGYVHVVAAALGLAVLFQAMPVVYSAFKLVGAAYLIWLGLKFVFVKTTPPRADPSRPAPSTRPVLWQSMLVEVLNPKTALFFIAFLPQFTDIQASMPLWGQLLLLGTVVNLMFSSADVLCVLLAERLISLSQGSPTSTLWANRLGGVILIGLGANLAFTR